MKLILQPTVYPVIHRRRVRFMAELPGFAPPRAFRKRRKAERWAQRQVDILKRYELSDYYERWIAASDWTPGKVCWYSVW